MCTYSHRRLEPQHLPTILFLDDVSTDREGYSCLPREKSIGRAHKRQSKQVN